MNTLTKPVIAGVLCYLLRRIDGHTEVCLAEKAPTKKAVDRGLAGKLMGYGGDLEGDWEGFDSAALREILEESGIVAHASGLRKFAEIDFDRAEWVYRCHHYFVESFSGEPRASAEMLSPRWYPTRAIPYHLMNPSDVRILPFALSGRFIKGTVYYEPDGTIRRNPNLELAHPF